MVAEGALLPVLMNPALVKTWSTTVRGSSSGVFQGDGVKASS